MSIIFFENDILEFINSNSSHVIQTNLDLYHFVDANINNKSLLTFIDTTKVTYMNKLFNTFKDFNILLLWNTGNVEHMNHIFHKENEYNKQLNFWNLDKVIDIYHILTKMHYNRQIF